MPPDDSRTRPRLSSARLRSTPIDEGVVDDRAVTVLAPTVPDQEPSLVVPDPDLDSFALGQQKRRVAEQLFGPDPEAMASSRYVVLEELGSGGMGHVYRAYDRELERTVAIKRLHYSHSSQARARFKREACAMAQLSHPNIVPVHEVVEIAGRSCIVMEYIVGLNLREWLAQAGHSWTDVVAVFKDAARGLAAIHTKGLIHRDFKPDNVMVGDERVQIMDFGLARTGDSWAEAAEDPMPEFDPSLPRSLTQPNNLLGTALYMAPEQFRCDPVSAATDQFAYCVAFHEALCGYHPFVGSAEPTVDADEVISKIEARQADTAGRPGAVPGWLWQIIERGLEPKPEDRHESMQALLDAIEASERSLGRRRRALVSVLLAATGALFGWSITDQPPAPDLAPTCEAQAADEIDEVWSSEARAKLEASIRAAGVSYDVEQTLDYVSSTLGEAVELWRVEAIGVCEARNSEGESADLHRRNDCVDRWAERIGDRIEAFTNEDEVVDALNHALELLEPLREAGDLCRTPPPVLPEAVRANIEDARDAWYLREWDRARTASSAALSRAETSGRACNPTGDDSLALAAARYEVGRANTEERPALALASLNEARSHALACRDQVLLAEIDIARAKVLAASPEGASLALTELDAARASLDAVAEPRDSIRRLELEHGRGYVQTELGLTSAALETFNRLLERLAELDEPSPMLTARVHSNLGKLHFRRREWDQALASFNASAGVIRSLLGDDHPRVHRAELDIGLTLLDQGRVSSAQPLLIRALEANPQPLPYLKALTALVSAYSDQAEPASRDARDLVGFVADNPRLPARERAQGMLVAAQALADEAQPDALRVFEHAQVLALEANDEHTALACGFGRAIELWDADQRSEALDELRSLREIASAHGWETELQQIEQVLTEYLDEAPNTPE